MHTIEMSFISVSILFITSFWDVTGGARSCKKVVFLELLYKYTISTTIRMKKMVNILSYWTVLTFLISSCLSARIAKRSVNWNGNNWAFSCDFRGNDLANVRIAPELCGGKCVAQQGCTHFIWTQWNGGTCWMKQGLVSKNDAFSTNDQTMVCGVLQDSQGGNRPSR